MTAYWDKSLKKYDKKGYAPIYKEVAEKFFSALKKHIFEFDVDKIKGIDEIHVENINYLSGYYIFPMGTNAVVHFKIKECPGWLFGIWWNQPELINKKSKSYKLVGNFFAQYEDLIDKFKPTASIIKADLTASIYKKSREPEFNQWYISDLDDVSDQIRFIMREPALAFCRDCWCWDYNKHYHDRRTAKKKFENWKAWFADKKKYTQICDEKILSFVKDNLLSHYGNAEILDQGENVSPRYQIICKKSEFMETVDAPGCYGICWEEEYPDLYEKWMAIERECKDISDQYAFVWRSPIEGDCIVIDDADYESYKKDMQS